MLTVLQKLGLSTNSLPPSGQPFDWLETVGQAQRMLGLNIMVGFWVSQDVRNTSRNLMVVSTCLHSCPSNHSYMSIPTHLYLSADHNILSMCLRDPTKEALGCIIWEC